MSSQSHSNEVHEQPKGWGQTSIGAVSDVIAGGTPKAGDPKNFAEPGNGIAWITPADLSKYSKKYIKNGARDLSQEGYDSSSAKLMPPNSLLFSSRAPIGYVAITQGEISTNQGFKSFVFHKNIEPSYAYYFLRGIRDLAESIGTGTTFKEISGATAKTLPFILPPLAEQKVIADKLDTLLAQVESTKARLDRIPDILKRFRQSVLAAAVSGKLTEEWIGENRSVDEVCVTGFDGPFGSKLKSSDYVEFGVRVVRLENIGHLQFNDEKRTFISNEKYLTLTKNTLEIGDVLFSSFVDEEVRVCVFEQKENTYVNKADCFCLRPHVGLVNSTYLAYVLASITSYNQIKEQVQGVTRPRINLKILKGLKFVFPPLKKQIEVVRRVEDLFAYAENIEQKSNAALARVNNLTQTILAKAFRGELTAEWRAANPDLISGEDSAEALLERIKSERAKISQESRTRKRKASK